MEGIVFVKATLWVEDAIAACRDFSDLVLKVVNLAIAIDLGPNRIFATKEPVNVPAFPTSMVEFVTNVFQVIMVSRIASHVSAMDTPAFATT